LWKVILAFRILTVGIAIEGYSPSEKKTLGYIYPDDFSITGPSSYTITMKNQRKNFAPVTPFATDHGAWDLYGQTLNEGDFGWEYEKTYQMVFPDIFHVSAVATTGTQGTRLATTRMDVRISHPPIT